jgi:hypothetical protein
LNLAGSWASGFEHWTVPDRIAPVPVRVWKTGPVKFAKVLKANANDQPIAAESPHETIVP